MHWLFILLLLVLIAAGYYVYQRLLKIEREIRAEQRALVDADENSPPATTPVMAPPVASVLEKTDSVVTGLTGKVLQLIKETPGMSQTELYTNFPSGKRRELQKLLRELDRQGDLRREKKGTSYQLYPY